jgi:hypothetical protein
LSYSVVFDAPTIEKPLGVQPLLPLSAPSLKTVCVPLVTLISSTWKPGTLVTSGLPCRARSVRYRNRSETVLPANADRSNVACVQSGWYPSMPLPSAALAIEPGMALKPLPSSTST